METAELFASKKAIKDKAQELIMTSIAATTSKIYEGLEGENMTEEQREIMIAEICKQADRVAKMFGYENAWFY